MSATIDKPIVTFLFNFETRDFERILFETQTLESRSGGKYQYFEDVDDTEHRKLFRNPNLLYCTTYIETWSGISRGCKPYEYIPFEAIPYLSDEYYKLTFTECNIDRLFEYMESVPNPDIRWHLVSAEIAMNAPHLVDVEKLDINAVSEEIPELKGKTSQQIKNHFLKLKL